MNPAAPMDPATINVSIAVILLVFAVLEWKLKGMQWPAFLLGGWLSAAVPEGSMIDDLWVSSLSVFQNIVVKGFETLGQLVNS